MALRLLERLIEENKERYYDTLEISSRGWHEGKNDAWPYTNFLLTSIKQAYRLLEERLGRMKAPRGEKAELIAGAIAGQKGPFRIIDIETACPGVGRDWIRVQLKAMKATGRIACQGKGIAARWMRKSG